MFWYCSRDFGLAFVRALVIFRNPYGKPVAMIMLGYCVCGEKHK